jgi:hypothetical protein
MLDVGDFFFVFLSIGSLFSLSPLFKPIFFFFFLSGFPWPTRKMH